MVTDRRLSSWAKARPLKSSNLYVVYLISCTFLCFTTTVSYPLFLPIIYSNRNGSTIHVISYTLNYAPVSCYDSLKSSNFVTAQEMCRWQTREIWAVILTSKNKCCSQRTYLDVRTRAGNSESSKLLNTHIVFRCVETCCTSPPLLNLVFKNNASVNSFSVTGYYVMAQKFIDGYCAVVVCWDFVLKNVAYMNARCVTALDEGVVF